MHCVDLGESFPTRICLQKSASIQPRTSPSKFGGKIIQYYSFGSLVEVTSQPRWSEKSGRQPGRLSPCETTMGKFNSMGSWENSIQYSLHSLEGTKVRREAFNRARELEREPFRIIGVFFAPFLLNLEEVCAKLAVVKFNTPWTQRKTGLTHGTHSSTRALCPSESSKSP